MAQKTAIVRVFLSDGTFKTFIVGSNENAAALKAQVVKKLKLSPDLATKYELYILDESANRKVEELRTDDNPFQLYNEWGPASGTSKKLLFMRTDEKELPTSFSRPPLSELNSTSPSSSNSPSAQSPKAHRTQSVQSSSKRNPNRHSLVADKSKLTTSPTPQRTLSTTNLKDNRSTLGKSLPEIPEIEYTQRKAAPSHVMIGDQKILIGGAEGEHIERDEKSKKIVIGWANKHLAARGSRISNLTTDLQDGLCLIHLLEEVSGKKLERYQTNPDSVTKKIDNINLWLKFLAYLGIKVTGVSAMDIYTGNEKIMLAIFLLIIKKYQSVPPRAAAYSFAKAKPQAIASVSQRDDKTRRNSGMMSAHRNLSTTTTQSVIFNEDGSVVTKTVRTTVTETIEVQITRKELTPEESALLKSQQGQTLVTVVENPPVPLPVSTASPTTPPQSSPSPTQSLVQAQPLLPSSLPQPPSPSPTPSHSSQPPSPSPTQPLPQMSSSTQSNTTSQQTVSELTKSDAQNNESHEPESGKSSNISSPSSSPESTTPLSPSVFNSSTLVSVQTPSNAHEISNSPSPSSTFPPTAEGSQQLLTVPSATMISSTVTSSQTNFVPSQSSSSRTITTKKSQDRKEHESTPKRQLPKLTVQSPAATVKSTVPLTSPKQRSLSCAHHRKSQDESSCCNK